MMPTKQKNVPFSETGDEKSRNLNEPPPKKRLRVLGFFVYAKAARNGKQKVHDHKKTKNHASMAHQNETILLPNHTARTTSNVHIHTTTKYPPFREPRKRLKTRYYTLGSNHVNFPSAQQQLSLPAHNRSAR